MSCTCNVVCCVDTGCAIQDSTPYDVLRPLGRKDRSCGIGEIHNDGVTGLHDMCRGYKNFLAPGAGANSQDILVEQCRIHKGAKLRRLPMEWRNRTNGISCGLLHRLRRGQLDVTRANGSLKMPRDGVLIPAYHN